MYTAQSQKASQLQRGEFFLKLESRCGYSTCGAVVSPHTDAGSIEKVRYLPLLHASADGGCLHPHVYPPASPGPKHSLWNLPACIQSSVVLWAKRGGLGDVGVSLGQCWGEVAWGGVGWRGGEGWDWVG